MIRRLALSAAAALSTAALAAPAAAAPVCMQITDPAGDGAPLSAGPASRDSLDILSGDIATGKKNLVAALRLKSVATDPMLVGGVVYYFRWVADGTLHALEYRVYGTGEKEAKLTIGESLDAVTVPADAVVDASTSTITWVVPRKQVPALTKPGAKLTSLRVNSSVGSSWKLPTGTSQGSSGADQATTTKTYTDRTATCLKGT